MTVSNVLGPLMVTFDRFLIGSIISIAAVAYYSIPYEVVTKLWLISSALIGVLFPAFSATNSVDRAPSGLSCMKAESNIFLFSCSLSLWFL